MRRAASLFLLILFISIMGCVTREERTNKFLIRGRRFLETGDYSTARVNFKNVIRLDPNSAEGFFLTGLCDYHLKQWDSALSNIRKALHLDPNHLKAHIKMGEFYLMAGNYEDALKEVDFVLNKRPEEMEAIYIKASALASQNKNDQAILVLEGGIEIDPEYVAHYTLLSKIFKKEERLEDAEAIIREGLQKNKGNTVLMLALANIQVEKQEYTEAETLYKEVVELNPNQPWPREKLALFLFQQGKLNDADAVIKNALSQFPRQSDLWLMSAEVYLKKGIYSEAIRVLNLGLKEYNEEDPEKLTIMNGLANIYILQQEYAQALEIINKILQTNPHDLDAHFSRGKIFLAQKKGEEAIVDFRKVVKDKPDIAEGYYYLALAHHLNGEKNLYFDNLKKALATSEKYAPALFALIDFYIDKGDYQSAQSELEELGKKGLVDADDCYKYALLLAKSGAPDKAVNSLKKSISIDKNYKPAHLALIDYYFGKGDYKSAKDEAETYIEKYPEDPIGYYKMGLIQAKAGDNELAVQEFEHHLRLKPNSINSLRNIVDIFIAEKRFERAFKKCEEHLASFEPKGAVYNLMSEIALKDKDLKLSEEYLKKAIDEDPDLLLPYLNLTNLYLTQGNIDSAITEFHGLQKRQPKSPSISFQLGILYEAKHDYPEAMKYYEHALQSDPNFIPAANNLAYRYAEHCSAQGEKLQKALVLAKKARQRFPENPHHTDTLGWVYYKMGDYDQAMKETLEALKRLPDNAEINYHLGMIYYKRGNIENAKRAFDRTMRAADANATAFTWYREAKNMYNQCLAKTQ